MRTSVVAIVGAALGLAASSAAAAPSRKVQITTEPAGATVYLSSKENGPVCPATPCTIDAPIGDTPLIIELENHVSLIENLSIPKRGNPMKVSYTLVAAVGTIKVDGPKGAKVTIGNEDRGTAPTEIEVEAGQYIVVLTLPGKPPESLPVDVEAGGEVTLSGSGTANATPTDDIEKPDDGGSVTKPAAPKRSGPLVRASVAVDIGFRDFVYENNQTTMTLSNEKEPGVVLAGPLIEVWPGTLFSVRALRGLSAVVRAQFGVNKLTLSGGLLGGTATTFWQSYEGSLRHRWTIKQKGTVEVGVGYVRDRHQFNADVDDVRFLPDADYQSVRIGGRGSLLFGAWEPYLAFENRIVVSAGALESRFDRAETSGLRGSVGVMATFGAIVGRLEASYTRYSWTFDYEADDEFKADGGVDAIKHVGLSVGYMY